MYLFVLKKFIAAFLLPPGIFIILLFFVAVATFRRRNRAMALFIAAVAILIWAAATGVTADKLMLGIEQGQVIPRQPHGDVIILLGGGVHEKSRDLTGTGAPAEEMMARVVTAVRAQRRLHLPVIVSGGAVAAGITPEAPIVRRFLQDLGVPGDMIIVEDKSRDTSENARYCKAICSRYGFKNPLLVTSAYHMRRSLIAFRREKLEVTPLPANFKSWTPREYIWLDYLPGADSLATTSAVLRERLGLVFYRLGGK